MFDIRLYFDGKENNFDGDIKTKFGDLDELCTFLSKSKQYKISSQSCSEFPLYYHYENGDYDNLVITFNDAIIYDSDIQDLGHYQDVDLRAGLGHGLGYNTLVREFNSQIDNIENLNESTENNMKIKLFEEEETFSTPNKYPEYIMEILRQRYNYDEDDTSNDNEFSRMSPSTVFEEVCGWEGVGSDYAIKSWIEDIYGFNIDDIKR